MPELSETPFRVYALSDDGSPRREYVCACATDDLSLADALVEQHRKGAVIVGIMYRPVDGEPGEWILNPWAKGA